VSTKTRATDLFAACCEAIANGVLIKKESRQDKEFHFQNWLQDRIEDAGIQYDQAGRNSYPDFTSVNEPEGFEVKGLGWPGREASYDSNSRVPTGLHNGRTVFYAFGRYPSDATELEYPVVDLVICHGDFINANHDYTHQNKSFRGFGSYGDLLVRDRKMYVAPTPYALTHGATGQRTLILPADYEVDDRFECVGTLVRTETKDLIEGYEFNLTTNVLTPKTSPNPHSGMSHTFKAYRLKGALGEPVSMVSAEKVKDALPPVEG